MNYTILKHHHIIIFVLPIDEACTEISVRSGPPVRSLHFQFGPRWVFGITPQHLRNVLLAEYMNDGIIPHEMLLYNRSICLEFGYIFYGESND